MAAAPLPTLAELEAAAVIIGRTFAPTPQQRWPLLDERTGAALWVKHENHTPVGAFKIRGGLVYLHELAASGHRPAGIVTATRGNHGQSIGFAAARHGIPACVVVPRGNSPEKNVAMRALGVELVERGDDFQAAAEAADAIATERGWYRLPSFHPWLVRGVGTWALELFRAAPALDALYVPIGLGSGLCGALAARDALGMTTEIIGVTSSHARAYALSLRSGCVESHPATTKIADGVACRTPVPDALETMRGRIARVVEVSDDEVAAAMRAIFRDTHNVAEGAGAAALAAIMAEREVVRGRTIGMVLCGGNVDSDVFAKVLSA